MRATRSVGSWRVFLPVAVALVVGAVAASGDVEPCLDCCYEDVVVSEGAWWANGRLWFDDLLQWKRPVFRLSEYKLDAVWVWLQISVDLQFEKVAGFAGWKLSAWYDTAYSACEVVYRNDSTSFTPPATGWYIHDISGYDLFWCTIECGLTVPKLSGGWVCPSSVALLPAGSVGFLDSGFPEGEEPPIAGEMEVSARYELGELVTGCCDAPDDVSYLTLTWYTVTIGDAFDLREPIDATVVRAASDGRFCFDIETVDWVPGYYDIRLGMPGGACEWIRVELVRAPEV